ncbi:MAG: hypothetical protein JW902_09780 [Syntrophaceae bacterium]|nr:hypothetical protein [Syntrophaceae bacterium]
MEIEKADYDYNLYFVCLFDLLGQRKKLKDWECHPKTYEEFNKAIVAIRDSAITISVYRKVLQQWMKESTCLFKEYIQKMNPETYEEIVKELSPTVRIQQFSDTFVLLAPAIRYSQQGFNKIEFVQLEHIFQMCSYLIIHSLVLENPIRGGITVGTGIWIDDHWFYGPALAEAYRLEKEVAQYPRFVISDSVFKLFDKGTEIFRATPDILDIIKFYNCKNYLVKDDDGCWILDFLGTQIQKIFSNMNQEVLKAYDFVEKCSQIFRDCKKLGPRYSQLQKYMIDRLQLWDPQSIDSHIEKKIEEIDYEGSL